MTDRLLNSCCGRARGRDWVRAVAGVAILALCLVVRPVCAGSQNLPGQYDLRRMLKFYVVNTNNVNFTASIRWLNNYQHQMDTPVLVRVYDPNENLVARHLEPGLRISGTPVWTIFSVPVTANGAQ